MSHLTREQLLDELQRISRRTIGLTLTTNTSSYVSFCASTEPLRARLQRSFLAAPEDVIVALGRWMGGREKRCPAVVRQFINRRLSSGDQQVERATRTKVLRPAGHCYHLGRILERVNGDCFQGRIRSGIGWGRQSPSRYVRVRTLGSYYRGQDIILINPVLDQPDVPQWFVEFTVYHECLHAVQLEGERPHNAAFKARLRSHPDYQRAMGWEKANIRLLTSRARPAASPKAGPADPKQHPAAAPRAAHQVRRPGRKHPKGQLPLW